MSNQSHLVSILIQEISPNINSINMVFVLMDGPLRLYWSFSPHWLALLVWIRVSHKFWIIKPRSRVCRCVHVPLCSFHRLLMFEQFCYCGQTWNLHLHVSKSRQTHFLFVLKDLLSLQFMLLLSCCQRGGLQCIWILRGRASQTLFYIFVPRVLRLFPSKVAFCASFDSSNVTQSRCLHFRVTSCCDGEQESKKQRESVSKLVIMQLCVFFSLNELFVCNFISNVKTDTEHMSFVLHFLCGRAKKIDFLVSVWDSDIFIGWL